MTTQPIRDIVLITGASGGIGADLARIFARNGHDLVLTARSESRLQSLADEIAATGAARPVIVALDLEIPGGADRLAEALDAKALRCKILVNNAGYGLAGKFAELSGPAQLAMIDLNVRALTEMTARFLPDIIAARGRILNNASIAAFYAGPGMAAYYATKSYVLSLSQALGFELRGAGVTVTALCPGPTDTGFQERAGLYAPVFTMMKPMDCMTVARAGYDGLMAGKAVVLPGWFNKLSAFLSSIVPRSLSMHAIGWLQDTRRHK